MLSLCFFKIGGTERLPCRVCHSHHLPGTSELETCWKRDVKCMESLRSLKRIHTGAFPWSQIHQTLGVMGAAVHRTPSWNTRSEQSLEELQESPLRSNSFLAAICCWQKGRGSASPKPPCIPQKGTFPPSRHAPRCPTPRLPAHQGIGFGWSQLHSRCLKIMLKIIWMAVANVHAGTAPSAQVHGGLPAPTCCVCHSKACMHFGTCLSFSWWTGRPEHPLPKTNSPPFAGETSLLLARAARGRYQEGKGPGSGTACPQHHARMHTMPQTPAPT